MKLKPFLLERYFAQHEFSARYLLSSSDCDGLAMADLLQLATREELGLWNKLTLGYTESSGWPRLREAIAKEYQTVSPDEVLVMSPGEANFIAMNVLLEKSDHVICVGPAYQSLYEVVYGIGCEVSFWNPQADAHGWHYQPDDLFSLLRTNTRLVIINFPHNPTGSLLTHADYKKIIHWADAHDLILFSDEMYRGLEHQEGDRLAAMCDVYSRGISLGGMAKTYALAGLRLGWVVIRDPQLREQAASYKDYLTICSSAPSEVLSWIGLNHQKPIIAANLAKIQSNVQLFKSFCERFPSVFTFIPPKAGSTAFVRLNLPEPAMQFSNRLVNETGIMTLPSEMFAFGDRHLRIGFGRKNMKEVLDVLSDYLNTRI